MSVSPARIAEEVAAPGATGAAPAGAPAPETVPDGVSSTPDSISSATGQETEVPQKSCLRHYFETAKARFERILSQIATYLSKLPLIGRLFASKVETSKENEDTEAVDARIETAREAARHGGTIVGLSTSPDVGGPTGAGK